MKEKLSPKVSATEDAAAINYNRLRSLRLVITTMAGSDYARAKDLLASLEAVYEADVTAGLIQREKTDDK